MPCEDPDDPCYCSGPKPPPKQQMTCRNTDQYCLHVPKGENRNYNTYLLYNLLNQNLLSILNFDLIL